MRQGRDADHGRSRLHSAQRALLRVGLLILALHAACGRTPQQGRSITWNAECHVDHASVGDAVRVTVHGLWPRTEDPAHLAWASPRDSLLLLSCDSTQVRVRGDGVGRDYALVLIAPRPGRVRIPPAALVSAQGETLAVAQGFTVEIAGRLREVTPDALRPLAPMASLRRFPLWAVAAGLALLAIAVAVWVWLRRRARRAAVAAMPPPPPPETEFSAALRALCARGLPERGEMRIYAQELSWILRRYLDRRWEQPALTATRPEILRWLPRTRLCVRDQGELATWLAQTDRMKFAGHIPTLAQAQGLVDTARDIVQRSETHFMPPPSEADGDSSPGAPASRGPRAGDSGTEVEAGGAA